MTPNIEPLQTNIHLGAGLFVKHTVFARDTLIPQHRHAYDHLSVIATGAARVWADGELLGDYAAPAGILIRAGVEHLFLALVDCTTVLCVHRVAADGGPEILENV